MSHITPTQADREVTCKEILQVRDESPPQAQESIMTTIDTTDLVQRLSEWNGYDDELHMEAITTITRLRAVNERLREAMERIALSGEGESVFERSALYGTFQDIDRNAISQGERRS